MEINGLDGSIKFKLFDEDKNGREINIYTLQNVIATGESLLYPNILFFCDKTKSSLVSPLDEKIMSLENITKITDFSDEKLLNLGENMDIEVNPVFFFIYNTENYYHFVYDTLPYLISYFELKKTNPKLKLLMSLPNSNKVSFYQFVIELLIINGIEDDDILMVNPNTLYKNVFVSNSYTHGIDSNLQPRYEVNYLYESIVNKVKNNKVYPKNIYISRRSWIHGDVTNIGTNYTNRRKLINEDELVSTLEEHGFIEVFTETMSMVDKINLFANADNIIGPIGGGLVNVLFSKSDCNLIAIISPEFLNINKRFIFSFNCVTLNMFEDVEHVEKTEFKLYMRVEVDNIVGEIIEITGDKCKILYSDTSVSGWNSESDYNQKECYLSDCVKLDNGLNSSWVIDLDKFKEKYL